MQKKIRPDPIIPDHEVLRKIGGGSYGEVWLARGVTGAMRAVKVVYREDFSDERTFEREFEGILRFEPISRDHPGFVNILHVGRADKESPFYYYVMELGDDSFSEGEINPVEYEPRTLRTDTTRANGEPLDTDFCIETGRRLAEALAALHERELTHRDIKPSNIIFVEGKAKLADIGLVAAKDQRTFVGTEGFVPPEGPGSAAADIYSLGKVLYEMATGMDRLQFPELPETMVPENQRKKWIRLNRIICEICEPRLEKRGMVTGEELALTLARLEEGKKAPKKVPPYFWPAAAVLFLLSLFFGHVMLGKSWGTIVIEGELVPLPPRFVGVKLVSDPDESEVWDLDGRLIGVTQTSLKNLEVGTELVLRFSKEGYHDRVLSIVVEDDGTQSMIIDQKLDRLPPQDDSPWQDALGNEYSPLDKTHVSDHYVVPEHWERFRSEEEGIPEASIIRDSEAGGEMNIVAVTEDWADRYAKWLGELCVREGFLAEVSEEDVENNFEFIINHGRDYPADRIPEDLRAQGKRPFRCEVRKIPYAILYVETSVQLDGAKVSNQDGASLYLNGEYVGPTPWSGRVSPGQEIRYVVELDGFRSESGLVVLEEKKERRVPIKLKKDDSVAFGGSETSWKNSLGMVFKPMGDDLMVSVWETRNRDFQTFVKSEKTPGFPKVPEGENLPVVNVTRADCKAFCEWLTERERAKNLLKERNVYRLATDAEWSLMAGLEETGAQPANRENEVQNEGFYPWGLAWPPIQGAGNYSDSTAADNAETPLDETIFNYSDGYEKLAPVGRFTANELGLYDLGGNVHEWVADNYKELGEIYGVLRGGGFETYRQEHVESRHRKVAEPTQRRAAYGFRIVLAKDEGEEEIFEPVDEVEPAETVN